MDSRWAAAMIGPGFGLAKVLREDKPVWAVAGFKDTLSR